MLQANLGIPTTELLLPNIVVVADYIMPVKVYPAKPDNATERAAVAEMLAKGEAGMITDATNASMNEAATVPACFEWILHGVPLPDITDFGTRMRLVERIKKAVLESEAIRARMASVAARN